MKSLDIRDNVVVNTYTFELKGQDLIQARDFINGSKSLMKYIVNRYETYLRQNVTDKGDTLLTTNGDKKILPSVSMGRRRFDPRQFAHLPQ